MVKRHKDLKTLGFMEIGDDTAHPITQIVKVPFVKNFSTPST
jgi:hypothetical protein